MIAPLLVFLGVVHKEKRRGRSLGVKTWVKASSSVILPYTDSVILGMSISQVFFWAVLVNGIVRIFLPLPGMPEMKYFAKLEILGSYKNKCKLKAS